MAHPKEILLSLRASARKSLSQNFLTSPHWAENLTRIVSEPRNIDEFWEIGPGLGALTQKLLDKIKKPLKVFEYDRKLAQYLREKFPNLDLTEGDFLTVNLKEVSPKSQRIAVISNLPYHLSSPIFFKLLEQKDRIVRQVLTFQREFAERLIALPRTKEYGALSILAQLHYRIESIGVLPPGAFYPAPAVASEALLIEPREVALQSPVHVSLVVKAAFKHRRKKLSSNLKQAFPTIPVEEVFSSLGLSAMARPEELTKEQFVNLTAEIKPHICAAVCEK